MKALTSCCSSKIVVDRRLLSRDVCMHRHQEMLFLKNQRHAAVLLGCLKLTCVERKSLLPVFSAYSDSQADLDAGESETQEKYEQKTVHVRIELQKECMFGEQFFIVGDDPMFGLWEPADAVPLNWSPGNIWTVELDIPIGKSIQFKFILEKIDGEFLWQPDPDRDFRTWETENTIVVCEDWEDAELQMIDEEDPAALSNMESRDSSRKLIVADILSHPGEKPVSQVSNGSASDENDSPPMTVKSLVETPKEEVSADKNSLEEKPVAVIAENIGSSDENPSVNANSKAPPKEKEDVSSKKTPTADDILGNNGKPAVTNETALENTMVSMIHDGDPVLVPGLTPSSTEPAEATIPSDDPKTSDFSSQEQQSMSQKSEEAENQNVPELDAIREDAGATHQEGKIEALDEQEQLDQQPDQELEEQSHLSIEENSNSKPSDNNVLLSDIEWGRKTLYKLLSNLGLF